MNKTILMVAIALGIVATSCKKDKKHAGIYKGPEVAVAQGKAYSWVKLDDNLKPVAFGITINKHAIETLPTAGEGHQHMNEYVLPIPEEANATPFKHVLVNWNPEGHEPETIYGVPHFDFHFYTIPSQERTQIPAWEADSAKFKNVPAPAFFPANYLYIGGGVPQMGSHLIDITSPELSGQQPFKETFIYGSFNGKVIFLETMVELNHFKAAVVDRAVPRPEKVQQQGLYPKHYKIIKDNDSYSIVFDDLEFRAQ